MLEKMLGDKTALVPEPTFGEYTRIFHGRITYRDDGLSSLKDIPNKNIEASAVIVFVNPNNPTGSCIKGTEIMELARQEPGKLIVVDESFIDFAAQASVQELLQEEKLSNVWVLKSLSKCLGVPGLRLGYVYSRDEDMIQDLQNQVPIWNSNSLAEYYLETILKFRRQLAESFESTIKDRNNLMEKLTQLTMVDRVYSSGSNFILVKLNIESPDLFTLRNYLLQKWNIYVKDCSSKFNDGNTDIRIAVRLPEENMLLVNALRGYYE
jgi:histidinol-phosphate/aromatic aminotransferase/cobyric acid decarboxylase-like protein